MMRERGEKEVVASSGKRNSSFLGMARKSIGRL
jgi:hypothetical protein